MTMSFEALNAAPPVNPAAPRPGRYLAPDKTAHDCVVESLSLDGATLVNCDGAPVGSTIVLYMDGLGRLVANVVASDGGTMDVVFDKAQSRLDPLKACLAGGATAIVDERRQHQRVNPQNPLKPVRLPDGNVKQCEIADISLSGALVILDELLPIGAPVWIGNWRGHVAERREDGTVIRFKDALDGEALAELTR